MVETILRITKSHTPSASPGAWAKFKKNSQIYKSPELTFHQIAKSNSSQKEKNDGYNDSDEDCHDSNSIAFPK